MISINSTLFGFCTNEKGLNRHRILGGGVLRNSKPDINGRYYIHFLRTNLSMDLKYACIEVLIPSMLEYLDCEDCKTGDWVDLEDSVGKWWLAEVIDIASHGLVKMNYVGWSHKYDEWFQWGDPRIARIHTH